jgi:hypothetical protein
MPSILFALLLAAGSPDAAPAMPSAAPGEMTPAQVKAHNAGLDRKDPAYIRCVRKAEVGSLVARKAVCKTNSQWAANEKATRAGMADLASDITTRSASGGAN